MSEIKAEQNRTAETAFQRFILGAGVGVGTGEPSDPPPSDPPAGSEGDPKPNPDEPKDPKPTETVEFWKAKAREQEKRAKANADKAAEYDKAEEARKSDEQKAADRVAAAEQRAAELELKNNRAEIAVTTGIPTDVLAGPEDSTPEAIQAYADKVLAWRDKAAPPKPPVGVHVANEGKEPPNVSLDEQIAAATKSGNHALAIRLKRQKARS